jgi:hypothetical protein
LQRAAAALIWASMSDKDEKREQRLAAALRENLKRRKVQARSLSDAEPKPGEER